MAPPPLDESRFLLMALETIPWYIAFTISVHWTLFSSAPTANGATLIWLLALFLPPISSTIFLLCRNDVQQEEWLRYNIYSMHELERKLLDLARSVPCALTLLNVGMWIVYEIESAMLDLQEPFVVLDAKKAGYLPEYYVWVTLKWAYFLLFSAGLGAAFTAGMHVVWMVLMEDFSLLLKYGTSYPQGKQKGQKTIEDSNLNVIEDVKETSDCITDIWLKGKKD